MVKRKFSGILILGLVFALAGGIDTQAQQEGKSLNVLIGELKGSKDKDEKSEYLELIRETTPKTAKEIQLLIDLLDDEDVDNKCVAMEVLGKIREKKAVPKIIKNLKHKDVKVMVTAAGVLGEIGDERAIEPLLENPDLMILEFGQSPLAKIGAPALPKLIEAAKKKSLLGLLPKEQPGKDRRSINAAYAIGKIRDRNAIPTLMTLLHEEDNDLRLAAVQALAAMDVKEAYPDFERMLKDKDDDIRIATLYALVKANKEKYLPTAMEILDKEDKGVGVLRSVIELLGNLKEKGAIPKLEKLLEHKDGSMRRRAAVALWKITGKVYKYKKDRMIESEDFSFKRNIKDIIKRDKVTLEFYEKDRQKLGEEQYNRLKKQQSEERLKREIHRELKRAQERGYLLEYSVDELIKEIESSGDKYDYK
ncbi:MAG: HEAT repeat domain-containing protein [Thermodesulfovibrionales bacterium]|nr:HEAT repeat domain-containing protein [Thermodesulfovibrionales bacterium]